MKGQIPVSQECQIPSAMVGKSLCCIPKDPWKARCYFCQVHKILTEENGLRSQEAVVASRVVEVAAEDVGKWITSARLLARNLPALYAHQQALLPARRCGEQH